MFNDDDECEFMTADEIYLAYFKECLIHLQNDLKCLCK